VTKIICERKRLRSLLKCANKEFPVKFQQQKNENKN